MAPRSEGVISCDHAPSAGQPWRSVRVRRETIEHSWCSGEGAPGVGSRFFWKDPKTWALAPLGLPLPLQAAQMLRARHPSMSLGQSASPSPAGALAPWWPAREGSEVASLTPGRVAQRETACPKPQQGRTPDSCLTRPACHLNSVLPFAVLPGRVQLQEFCKPLGDGEGLPSVCISLRGARSCV